jgi:hypothetical protein
VWCGELKVCDGVALGNSDRQEMAQKGKLSVVALMAVSGERQAAAPTLVRGELVCPFICGQGGWSPGPRDTLGQQGWVATTACGTRHGDGGHGGGDRLGAAPRGARGVG